LVSKTIRKDLKQQVVQLKVKPVISCILVGNDPVSGIYVRNKVKACEEAGIESIISTLGDNSTITKYD
jgi:methylenetetrahydrofolate dehydrogenase (NADP+) / methenyltetrahydrofolate cyclohydrolase